MGVVASCRAVAGVVALACSPALAEPAPVVVELFTSQGCSSCPPADAFLSDLAHSTANVLPLAFHVTYWDRLGWRDPFSLAAATERQRAYARSLGDGQVYTPEMVVGGMQGFVGSEREQGLGLIARAAADAAAVPLRVWREGDGVMVSVGAGRERAEILLVGYDREHRTPVGRGENGGRTLLESNIVRSLTPLGQWDGAAMRVGGKAPEGERLAVLLQAGNGRIVSAATEQP